MMVPLLKGSPILLTKYTSAFPKNASVNGKSSLNIKRRMATETKLAITKPLRSTSLLFLK